MAEAFCFEDCDCVRQLHGRAHTPMVFSLLLDVSCRYWTRPASSTDRVSRWSLDWDARTDSSRGLIPNFQNDNFAPGVGTTGGQLLFCRAEATSCAAPNLFVIAQWFAPRGSDPEKGGDLKEDTGRETQGLNCDCYVACSVADRINDHNKRERK